MIVVTKSFKAHADNAHPFVWPKNKKGDEIEQRVGQNAPGSGKHRREQEKIIDAFLAGYAFKGENNKTK